MQRIAAFLSTAHRLPTGLPKLLAASGSDLSRQSAMLHDILNSTATATALAKKLNSYMLPYSYCMLSPL